MSWHSKKPKQATLNSLVVQSAQLYRNGGAPNVCAVAFFHALM